VVTESTINQPIRWKWRAEALAYAAMESVLGLLPGSVVFKVGEALGGVAWHFMPKRRRVILRNLRIAFHGEYNLAELQRMARETTRRTAANLFSAAHTARLSSTQINEILTVENQDLVDKALSGAPGLVLLPPHMGNWEILSRMNRVFPQGHAIGAFYRPLNNPLMNARVVAQRQTDGTHLFSKRDSLHLVTGFLRDGGLVGILADQRVGRQGELVRFFGRLTRASPLPSLMVRRSKSEVLSISVITESPGKWSVRYHPVKPPLKTADCMAALEVAMRASPLDVFWFQERWKVYVNKRRTIREWLGPETPDQGKPHRALLWLAGAPLSWQLPESWVHGDVIYEVVLAEGQSRPSWLSGNEIVHTVPAVGGLRALQRAIATIDLAAALPVDYILTYAATKPLSRAARREAIPLVSLATPA
jgi:KDO2-lipid IV(A) lauroyltransferase